MLVFHNKTKFSLSQRFKNLKRREEIKYFSFYLHFEQLYFQAIILFYIRNVVRRTHTVSAALAEDVCRVYESARQWTQGERSKPIATAIHESTNHFYSKIYTFAAVCLDHSTGLR